MTIFVGIDDTDNAESRGTGRLARGIAAELSHDLPVRGVTRHQLFVHPDIPYTSHNSAAVIHVEGDADPARIFRSVRGLMLADFVEGSDPGLAVAVDSQVTPMMTAFGLDGKTMIVDQDRARAVAKNAGILLEGLGGTEGGVIGAVAGIGLAATGSDGRFLMKGTSRDLKGSVRSVADVLAAGIDLVATLEGRIIGDGDIDLSYSANPSLVRGKAVLFVEERDGRLVALKRS